MARNTEVAQHVVHFKVNVKPTSEDQRPEEHKHNTPKQSKEANDMQSGVPCTLGPERPQEDTAFVVTENFSDFGVSLLRLLSP